MQSTRISLSAAALAALSLTTDATLSAQDMAWAWVEPVPGVSTFTPVMDHQFMSSGGVITVDRHPTLQHRFSVRMPAMVPANGVPHVSAYRGNHTAVVIGWYDVGGNLEISVGLYDASGAPAPDAPFTVQYRRPGPITEDVAYLYADKPTDFHYTPSVQYQWNGNRAQTSIMRMSTGVYEARLPGLATAGYVDRGNVQVTPVGVPACRAKVDSWVNDGTDVIATVRVFDMNGDPADSRFNLTYSERAGWIGATAGSGAHVWASEPMRSHYSPDPDYTDSNGNRGPANAQTIDRVGVGRYRVNLPAMQSGRSSSALVTAYGDDATFASIRRWTDNGCFGTFVDVDTFAPDGTPTDAKFSLSYVTDEPATTQAVAWAWVDPMGMGSSFTADYGYQYSSSGEPVRVVRASEANRFYVELPGMAPYTGVAHASAYGGNHTAVVNGWWSIGTTVRIAIELFHPNGSPAYDAAFCVHYRRGGNDRDREAYAYANQPTNPGYALPPSHSWNSKRAGPFVNRIATGLYEVTLPGLANGADPEKGHVRVTPVSNDHVRARVLTWLDSGDDLVVRVRTSDSGGLPVDSKFALTYCQRAAPIGDHVGSGAHVFANNPTAANYSPNANFTDSNGTYGPSNAETIQRLGTGRYLVSLPSLAPSDSSIALVSGYGNGVYHPAIVGWGAGPTGGTTVTVTTHDPAGNAADAPFVLTYLTDHPALGGNAATTSSYGSGCNGPTLTAESRPVRCTDWHLELGDVPGHAIIGFVQLDVMQQNTNLGAGAPGCYQLTGAAVTRLLPLPLGSPAYSLTIPADPGLVGLPLFAQGGAFVPQANPYWLAVSNGVRGVVGDR